MYEYIKGMLTDKKKDYVVIENNGLGYKVFTSMNTATKLVTGENAMLYTYLHVREDVMLLYGFFEKEELFLFNMLIGISGIGPKAALSILSVHTCQDVAAAIVCDDVDYLTKAPGIGKKTAMRIILELKDKLKGIEQSEPGYKKDDKMNEKYSEAMNALLVLGYNVKHAKIALDSVFDQNDSVQDIIRKSLAFGKIQ